MDGGRAHIVVGAADAEAARTFIVEPDELSPQIQAQMLGALGFDAGLARVNRGAMGVWPDCSAYLRVRA